MKVWRLTCIIRIAVISLATLPLQNKQPVQQVPKSVIPKWNQILKDKQASAALLSQKNQD